MLLKQLQKIDLWNQSRYKDRQRLAISKRLRSWETCMPSGMRLMDLMPSLEIPKAKKFVMSSDPWFLKRDQSIERLFN